MTITGYTTHMLKKWNLQDIRPARPEHAPTQSPAPTRKLSQDIAPRHREPMQEPSYDPDLENISITDGNSSRRKRVVVSVIIAILILGSAFFVNLLMGGAKVTVYPKFKDVSVQATFITSKSPAAGELGYELLTLEATGERQVTASGTEKVSERAGGTIFVYNTQIGTSQRLIKNTRFENPEGLIFRIKESIEVPGATKDAKGAVAPGVVTTEVFADGTGEQYNAPASRFTIPGLKGSDQFTSVYGESNSAFTGGFEGERYIIDEAELETKKQELHLELRNSLLERLKTERPLGFVVFDSAVTFAFETLPATSYGNSLATIKEKAYLNVPIFKESEFSKYLAESTIAGYDGEGVLSTDPTALIFEYTTATTTTSNISTLLQLEFKLKGTTRIVWQYDAEKLKSDLLGLSKTALPTVLSGYPSIDRAEATIRPFWSQNFPKDTSEITVTTVLEKITESQ